MKVLPSLSVLFYFLHLIVKESKSSSVVFDSLWPYGIVHGILQARILEWVAVPFSRGSSQPRDQIQVSRIAGRFCTVWAIREAQSGFTGAQKGPGAAQHCTCCFMNSNLPPVRLFNNLLLNYRNTVLFILGLFHVALYRMCNYCILLVLSRLKVTEWVKRSMSGSD